MLCPLDSLVSSIEKGQPSDALLPTVASDGTFSEKGRFQGAASQSGSPSMSASDVLLSAVASDGTLALGEEVRFQGASSLSDSPSMSASDALLPTVATDGTLAGHGRFGGALS